MQFNKSISLIFLLGLLSLFGLGAKEHLPKTAVAAISGRVVDAGGQAVGGATVFVRGQEMIYSFSTDSMGSWLAGTLPVGTYNFYAVMPYHDVWVRPQQVKVTAPLNLLLTLPPSTNMIMNGDFEDSNVWEEWHRFNGEVIITPDAFDGQAAARLGESRGEEVACSQNGRAGNIWSLKQTVIVPNDNNPTLSFVYKIATSQNRFDYAWLEVVLLVNGQPTYLIPWGELWQSTDWNLRSLDLTAWRGQTAEVLFQAVNCADQTFSATLDRISLGGVKSPSPTPLPNITVTPLPNVTVTPSPHDTPTPNPNADYVATIRKLTACENSGNHHIFIYVEDKNGAGIPNIRLRVYWPSGEVIIKTGTKIEHAGLVDFPMFKGSYWVELLDGTSDVVGPITPDIPLNETCEKTGNPVGNSLYHYSYKLLFTKK